MAKIPEDIIKAGRRCYDGLGRGSVSDSEHIARAILAAEKRGEERERERCAKVAQDAADEHYMIIKAGKGEHGKPGYVTDSVWNSWIGRHGALSSIAAAIRKGSD